jgi:hypothetical protein
LNGRLNDVSEARRRSGQETPAARHLSEGNIMKTILASVLALGLMTSAALATPAKLTTAQMDGVRAGQSSSVAFGCIVNLGLGVLGQGAAVCQTSAGGQ